MMYQIRTLNNISQKGLSYLSAETFRYGENIESPNGYLVRSAQINHDQLVKSLLCIARAGAGVNNIPVEQCSQKGIVVFNTPGANANAVKELVVASLLLASRGIVDGINWARSLGEDKNIEKCVEAGKSAFIGQEIAGKTLGVVGLGAIGIMVANTAKDLDMDVLGYDPFISVDAAWGLSRSVKKATSFDEVLQNADYITLHVPMSNDTKNMLNQATFSKMKKGVKILNFSRGGLINTSDMKEALASGQIGFYVTDFPDEQTIHLKNTICIPHLGASTPESEENCAIMAAEQTKNYLGNTSQCSFQQTGGRWWKKEGD